MTIHHSKQASGAEIRVATSMMLAAYRILGHHSACQRD
jgi:hypothetical protein